MGRRPEYTFSQKGQTDRQQAQEKMLNITHHMQIKTTIKCHICHNSYLSSKTTKIANVSEYVNTKRSLKQYWQECNLVQPLWETVQRFLKKLEIKLPYNPEFSLLNIYLEKGETPISKDCTNPNVHGSTIYNSQDMEITQAFIGR